MIKKTLTCSVLFFLVLLPISANAQSTDLNQQIKISDPFNCGATSNGDCTLMDVINAILNNIVMPIAAVVVVIYIIYAGFTYVTAQGKPAEIEKAHQRLLWALVGAGILLGAVGISAVVQSTVKLFLAP